MEKLTRRYTAEPEALIAVLCPLLVPIRTVDKRIFVVEGQSHARATFTVQLADDNIGALVRGRTGKFVPAAYGGGEPGWREIAKGRIMTVDYATGVAEGEIYLGFGGSAQKDKRLLRAALDRLTENDFLEIDQYGAAAKTLSGLTEYYLVEYLKSRGFQVVRIPEDMAAHLGHYMNFDFLIKRDGIQKRLEAKSLWGTNTRFARLIHSLTTKPSGDPSTWTEAEKGNYYPTSSCKFATQDFFAVSLFLRSGNIREFAFARSVPADEKPYGLPRARRYPEHVGQNPSCQIGDGVWFATIDEVWALP
jgi:hypothetical protein